MTPAELAAADQRRSAVRSLNGNAARVNRSDVMSQILSILRPPAFEDGFNGETPAHLLRPGWVSVVEFDRHGNAGYSCTAPLLQENDDAILVSVSGKTIAVLKKDSRITRSVPA